MRLKIFGRKRRRRVACLLMTTALVLSGCNSIQVQEDAPDYSVGVVLKAINSPYWLDVEAGMREAATELNIDLTILYPSGEQEVEEQEDLIRDMLNSDVDLCVVAPNDSYHTAWIKEKAQENEIVFLTVDDKAMDAEVPFIGSDNIQIGNLAAEYFNRTLLDGSSLYILLGPENQTSNIDRLEGIREAMNPSFHIQEITYTELTEENGYQAILAAEEEIDGIFCQNVVACFGAAVALEEKGWDAKVITVDTGEDASQVIRSGVIDAFLQQDGHEIGYEAIYMAERTLRSGELPEDRLFDSKIITGEE